MTVNTVRSLPSSLTPLPPLADPRYVLGEADSKSSHSSSCWIPSVKKDIQPYEYHDVSVRGITVFQIPFWLVVTPH